MLAASTLTTMEFADQAKANPIYKPEKYPMEHGYVRSNGTVDPPLLPIQRSGNVYVLTDNIVNYTIEIQKDNVTFDGNGFSLTTPPDAKKDEYSIQKTGDPSIQISSKNNIIIKNVRFEKCFTGISVENSSSIIIIQNTIANGMGVGVSMSSCANCSIIGNEINDTGLWLKDSTFIDIAYNRISKISSYAAWLSVNYTNISRNDIVDNFDYGLYFWGPISNNRIFENNFINNKNCLLYEGFPSMGVNDRVFNNYWSGNQAAIENGRDGVSYGAGDVDESPLSSPVSTTFDPSLFPLPSFAPDDASAPKAEPDSKPFSTVLLIVASGASLAVVSIGITVYFKKRNHSSETTKKAGGQMYAQILF